jgi:hypothetical protein
VNSVGGFGMWRSNPNNLQSVWGTRAAWNNNTPNWAGYNGFWLGLKALGFTGTTFIGMGLRICDGWPDGPMNPGLQSDANIYGQMAVKIAQQMIADGYTNPNIVFEGINEPDNIYSPANAAMYCEAISVALKGANFNYPVSGPVMANAPFPSAPSHNALTPAFVSAMGANLAILNFHMYGVAASDNGAYQAGDFPARIGNALGLGTLGASYGYDSIAQLVASQAPGRPLAMTEYNGYGLYVAGGQFSPIQGAQITEQQTNVGAVFVAIAILKAIQGGLKYGALWHGYEDLPNLLETYGVINGANVDNTTGKNYQPWHIYPNAWVMGRLFQKMPGNVVPSTQIPSQSLFTAATVSGSAWGFTIVNYGTSAQLVTANIPTNPASAVYFEISGANLSPPLIVTKTAAQLAALTIPPMSVIILSSS